MMRVLIVIPAYNEAQNLERVVDSLIACCPQFDYVIVPNADDKNYKDPLDRNLLYIACTRALHILKLFRY